MINKYFLRQCLVATGFILQCFSVNISLAFPSILIPILLSSNAKEFRITPDEASWLASCNTITGLIGLFTLPPIMQKYGRKVINIGTAVTQLMGWLLYIFTNSVATLYVARLTHGLCLGSVYLHCVIASEYSDPKRRGYLVAIKKMMGTVGVLTCHALSLSCTWKQIAIFAIFPYIMIIINGLYWPESPSYLAMKGKFEECKYSFYWLHGKSTEKQNELKILMAAQTETMLKNKRKKSNIIIEILYSFRDKIFLKSFILTTLLILAIDVSGRFYLLTYVIQIIREIVSDEVTAGYCTIVVDLLTILASFLSIFLIHNLKRRTVLFSSGIFSGTLMLILSLILFLKQQYQLDSYSSVRWSSICIVILLNFVLYVGLIPVSYNISGEIFPVEYRGIGPSVSGLSFMTFYFTTMKYTPAIIDGTGLHGMYLIYGLCLLLCILVLYFILPETKDRTLQDIEDEMKGVNRTATEVKPMLDETMEECAK
ncbi:facilitated trehalose transporter Tret1-like [Achroia grisella]|uniref:facilitated trehalose transporter Tret1-like n=1 Tax=Achroia grisella TaxID=688607 RepID=UPI0027D28DA8|nr:facilitated trehalose transporter Tret1-like [Achroia grisella]